MCVCVCVWERERERINAASFLHVIIRWKLPVEVVEGTRVLNLLYLTTSYSQDDTQSMSAPND